MSNRNKIPRTRISRIKLFAAAGAFALTLTLAAAVAPATAQESVKIGLILPMTGGQASTGMQLDNGIKLYMQQHGDTVAGKKIEVIRKDVGGIAPKSPSASPRNSSCATTSTSSPASP